MSKGTGSPVTPLLSATHALPPELTVIVAHAVGPTTMVRLVGCLGVFLDTSARRSSFIFREGRVVNCCSFPRLCVVSVLRTA